MQVFLLLILSLKRQSIMVRAQYSRLTKRVLLQYALIIHGIILAKRFSHVTQLSSRANYSKWHVEKILLFHYSLLSPFLCFTTDPFAQKFKFFANLITYFVNTRAVQI